MAAWVAASNLPCERRYFVAKYAVWVSFLEPQEMKRAALYVRINLLASILILMMMASPATGQEISLYAGNGEPVAYIAVNDDRTIYLWDGEPVAYL